jgi:hypothetical protein
MDAKTLVALAVEVFVDMSLMVENLVFGLGTLVAEMLSVETILPITR